MTIEPRPRAKACDQCYRKKQGCSKTQPKCERCLVTSSPCTYSFGKFMGKPKRSTLRMEEENYIKSKSMNSVQTCFRKGSPEGEGRVSLPTPTSSLGKSSPSPRSPPFQPQQKVALKRLPSEDSIANSVSSQRTLKRDQSDSPEASSDIRSPKRSRTSPEPSHSPASEVSSINPSVLHATGSLAHPDANCDPMMLSMDFMNGEEFLDCELAPGPLSPLPLVDPTHSPHTHVEPFGDSEGLSLGQGADGRVDMASDPAACIIQQQHHHHQEPQPSLDLSLQWMGMSKSLDGSDFSRTPASEYTPSNSPDPTGCLCLSSAVGALSAIHDTVQFSDHQAPDKVISAARRGFSACKTMLTQCQAGCSKNVVVVSLCVSILDQIRRAYDLLVSNRMAALPSMSVRLGDLEWGLFDSSVLTTILEIEKKEGAAICAMLQGMTRLGMPVDQHLTGLLEAFRGQI